MVRPAVRDGGPVGARDAVTDAKDAVAGPRSALGAPGWVAPAAGTPGGPRAALGDGEPLAAAGALPVGAGPRELCGVEATPGDASTPKNGSAPERLEPGACAASPAAGG